MDSFLTVLSRAKGKLSLSCGDLTAVSDDDDCNRKPNGSKKKSWSRFRRHRSTETIDRATRAKSTSPTNELANNFDCLLAEVREKLAMFREQDIKFRDRMDSLGNTIDEVASLRSSMNSLLTPSEASRDSDRLKDNSEEQDDSDLEDDDQIIRDKIENISKSFSSELLSCIPTIEVTCYKRRRSSDPTMHESARIIRTSMPSEPHEISSADYALCSGSVDEGMSTILSTA